MSLPRLLAHLKQGWSTHKDAGIHHRQSVQTKELPFLDACTGLRSLPHGHQNLAFNDNIQGVHRVCCLLIWSDTSGSPRTLVQEPALKAIMAYTHTHTHTYIQAHIHTQNIRTLPLSGAAPVEAIFRHSRSTTTTRK